MEALRKEAAWELASRLARWGATPIAKTPKLLMELRNKSQLDAIEHAGRALGDRFQTQPIRRFLNRVKAPQAFSAVSKPFVGAERAAAIGRKSTDFISENPLLAAGVAAPFPGAAIATGLLDKGRRAIVNHTPGVPMPGFQKVGHQLDSFADELAKIADVQVHDTLEGIKRELQPGDILYTKPRETDGVFDAAFYALESKVQGSKYTHVGLYAGDGKVVDAGRWKTRGGEHRTGVHLVPLATVADRYDFKVLRVDATPEQKAAAVTYAKEQVGKDFNIAGMLRAGLPWKDKATREGRNRHPEAEKFFCSELVVNAYADTNLAKKRALLHVVPGDIHRSNLTRTVARFDRKPMEKNAAVAPYQQQTQHTCSAACMKAVFDHYGFEIDEHDLAGMMSVRQRGGAETDQIADAARRLGMASFEYSFESLEQAKIVLDQDIPIIADIQSFNHPGSGHYVVITSIDDVGVHLMDPNTPGNLRTIPHEEMELRWWDRAMKPPHQMMRRWGIIVLPPETP